MKPLIEINTDNVWKIIQADNLNEWKGIILHHSAYASKRDQAHVIHQWHLKRGWRGIGYHFVVEQSGKVFATFRWINQLSGSHCPKMNNDYMGICLAGNFNFHNPTKKQTVSYFQLLRILDYSIVMPHWLAKNTACPGKYFPLKETYELTDNLSFKKYWRR